MASRRGSTVLLGFRSEDGQVYQVLLKRGAFGPEHAVREPEQRDMADAGRWPAPTDGAHIERDLKIEPSPV